VDTTPTANLAASNAAVVAALADDVQPAPAAPPRLIAKPASAPAERDLRLDLFRGLALWLIFLDHIPSNIVSWITIRNYGFSDATEIFVFISGYTAAFVYGRAMRERGVVIASARMLKRAWQVYVAHIFLFVIYMAEIAYVSASFENPLFNEEMGIFDFLKQPDVTLVQALLLKFKPANMDVLPLYITLLAGFAPFIWLLLRQPTVALLASALIYALSWHFGWALPSYPDGTWVFNPFAWQLMFGFGAWCALGGAEKLGNVVRSNVAFGVAAAYLLFALAVVMTWYFPRYGYLVPRWLADWMYPIDKTNLDVLRFAHFLALAVITVRFIPKNWPFLKSPLFKPAILCGQHSLEIFCLGVFLAFAAHFTLEQVSARVAAQVALSMIGILLMIAAAAIMSWYKKIEGRSPGSRPPKDVDADLAGGEA
jgi:hypothetical protein